jgi:rubrerythrin
MKSNTVDDVLEFAISCEEQAHQRYRELADRIEDPGLAEIVRSLADEEQRHRERLRAVAAGDLSSVRPRQGAEWLSCELTQAAEPGPEATLTQVMRFAISLEQQAFHLYMSLATASTDPGLATVFRTLAGQEAEHAEYLEKIEQKLA